MQRERARERMERARRQWELEHADGQLKGGAGASMNNHHNHAPSYEATVLSMVILYFPKLFKMI